MKTLLRSGTVLVLLCFAISFSLRGYGQQVQKGLTASNGVYIGFLQFTPPDYNNGQKHPLIIFLHGIGERGDGTTQLSMVANNPIPALLGGNASMKFTYKGVTASYCVLSPQLSQSYGGWQDFYVDEMLQYAKQNLNIDTTRIYLAGLSLGGGGVWHYASSSLAHAQAFAAMAPVCGIYQLVDPANIANAMLPVWAFHAINDNVVSFTNTTNQVSAVNQLKPNLALQTIYGSGDHYIWTRTFDTAHKIWDTYPSGNITQNPNIFEWFLQFRRMPVGTPLAPIARAGADTALTLPTTATTLDGSLSYDPDGSIVSYSWTRMSGPTQYTLASSTSATTALSNLVQGTYTFRLTVTDNSGMSSYDDITILVKQPGNMPPVSIAGPPSTITLPVNSATLDGSASYDPDGLIYQYQWTQVSGPATATIASPATATTSVTNLVQGVYKFSLRVWDNLWTPNTRDDTVTVTVNAAAPPPPPPPPNRPPVANAGKDTVITLPANSASLNGSSSYDPDGTIVSYSWSWVSGPAQYTIASPSAAITAISNLVQGTYMFRLTVTDNMGASASAGVQVTVNAAPPPPPPPPPPANKPPVAIADSSVTMTLPANSAVLDGSRSYDPDGTITAYSWSWISGPAQYTITSPGSVRTSVTNLTQGTYVFGLKVTDNKGATSTASLTITVNPKPNIPPVARAGKDQSVLPGQTVTLDGSASYDPDGYIIGYGWSMAMGSGGAVTIANASTPIASVTGLVTGVYIFELTVLDNGGAVSRDSVKITVAAAVTPGQPVAVAGRDSTIALPQNSIMLDGSRSYDKNGYINSYAWKQLNGPSSSVLQNAAAAQTMAGGLVAGRYAFELTVADSGGAVSKDTVKITVMNTMRSEEHLLLYPNPVSDNLHIRCTADAAGQVRITILNAHGQIIKLLGATKGPSYFDLSTAVKGMQPGIYYVEVLVDNKTRMMARFVKL